MKKAEALFLASAFTFSVLTGCGSTQSSSTNQSAAADGSSTEENAKDFGKLKVSFPAGAVRVSTNILALGLGYFEEEGLGFTPLEYALLYADAYDLELVTPSGALSPDYVCCREVTSASRYKEKYDAFVAYETARIRAFEYYKLGETDETVRENVVKIVCDYTGKEKDYVDTCL